jgi:hypothetical protein
MGKSILAFFESRAGFDLSFNYTTFQGCAAVDETQVHLSAVSFNGGLLNYCNCNATHNRIVCVDKTFEGIASVKSRGSINIADSTFESNCYIPVLAILSITPFKVVTRINFVGNRDSEDAAGLISFTYELLISNSIIRNNTIRSYFNVIDKEMQESNEQFMVKFVGCQIDEKMPDNNENAAFFVADPEQFNKKDAATLELNLLNMGVCQGNVITSTNWGVVVIVLILIIVVVLAAVAILLYISGGNISNLCKKFKHKRSIPDYEIGLSDIQVAQEQE